MDFDDPSLIAAYARRNVPPTHDGPGIQESLFGRYKHNYTNQDKLSNKQIDQVLFKHFTFRQMMVHRFVEDFQNGKKDKGIEEAKMRYKSVQGRINLDHENPEDTVEEISPEHLVRKSPRKRKKTVNLSLTPATKKVKKMLFSQDADMNEPYDTSKGSISPGFCQFSKNKNVRKIQSAQLKKTYHKEIAAENQKLEEKKLRRQAATIAGDKSTEDLNADGNDDFTDKYISQKIAEADDPIPIEEILFSDTREKPNESAWETLKAISLDSEDFDSIATNRYYDVPKSNVVFGYAATLFNEIKPKDARTRPEKVCFKYAHSASEKRTFIFVNIETNSPIRRHKKIPYMIQLIASLEPNSTKLYEGIFNLFSTQHSIDDDIVQRRKIKVEGDITAVIRNIKSIQDIYPFVLEPAIELPDSQSEASPLDHDLEISSYVLIR